jgi:hypothetical protein
VQATLEGVPIEKRADNKTAPGRKPTTPPTLPPTYAILTSSMSLVSSQKASSVRRSDGDQGNLA